jgi:hypothetical protein
MFVVRVMYRTSSQTLAFGSMRTSVPGTSSRQTLPWFRGSSGWSASGSRAASTWGPA